jgi:hypothetical protein
MSDEQAMRYDFRVKAFLALIERLEEYAGIVNSYTGVSSPRFHHKTTEIQYGLFSEKRSFLVVGKTCTGKTEFGIAARNQMGKSFPKLYEASSFMKHVVYEEDYDISDKNAAILVAKKYGKDVVARVIFEQEGFDIAQNYIVTGLRTIEEINYIKERDPSATIVHIESLDKERYSRYIARGRDDSPLTYSEFMSQDYNQLFFNLPLISEEICDVKVINDGTLEEYHSKVIAVIQGVQSKGVVDNSKIKVRLKKLVFLCLYLFHSKEIRIKDLDKKRSARILEHYKNNIRDDETFNLVMPPTIPFNKIHNRYLDFGLIEKDDQGFFLNSTGDSFLRLIFFRFRLFSLPTASLEL